MIKTPQCEKCDGRTYLSRREPSPAHRPGHEVQTFRCASCENLQAREVDLDAAT